MNWIPRIASWSGAGKIRKPTVRLQRFCRPNPRRQLPLRSTGDLPRALFWQQFGHTIEQMRRCEQRPQRGQGQAARSDDDLMFLNLPLLRMQFEMECLYNATRISTHLAVMVAASSRLMPVGRRISTEPPKLVASAFPMPAGSTFLLAILLAIPPTLTTASSWLLNS